jgi:large subunit ribosomal protein L1
MGKKRIRVVGAEETAKPKKEERKIVKTGKEHGRITDMGQIALAEAEKIAEKEKQAAKEALTLVEKAAPKAKKEKRPAPKRGRRYLAARKKIDRNKLYPLDQAIGLVKETSVSRFNGSIQLHLTVKETGLTGEISFPHSTGKDQKIVIADDELIEKIKKGKIDFDLLLASPAMMPKLASLAKILGPKGLMPNPKTGTISENPKKLALKLAGKTRYRTEKKAPLIHLAIGRLDQPDKELVENIQAVLNTIDPANIKKAVLAATMGPGIKIDFNS